MTGVDVARRAIPVMRANLQAAVNQSDKLFPVGIGSRSHSRFMQAAFVTKQRHHARSILTLGKSPDTVLIARSMIEGLAQLLWAMKQPRRRPMLWRSFSFVVDWRLMREQRAQGKSIDSVAERRIRQGLQRYGRLFLTPKAQRAKAAGRPLPSDPYRKNWYEERETEILRDVGGHLLLDYAYGPFSEWHHWRVGGFRGRISYDEVAATYTMVTEEPHLTATALASAFQCLWQSLQILNRGCQLRVGAELQALRRRQLALRRLETS